MSVLRRVRFPAELLAGDLPADLRRQAVKLEKAASKLAGEWAALEARIHVKRDAWLVPHETVSQNGRALTGRLGRTAYPPSRLPELRDQRDLVEKAEQLFGRLAKWVGEVEQHYRQRQREIAERINQVIAEWRQAMDWPVEQSVDLHAARYAVPGLARLLLERERTRQDVSVAEQLKHEYEAWQHAARREQAELTNAIRHEEANEANARTWAKVWGDKKLLDAHELLPVDSAAGAHSLEPAVMGPAAAN